MINLPNSCQETFKPAQNTNLIADNNTTIM